MMLAMLITGVVRFSGAVLDVSAYDTEVTVTVETITVEQYPELFAFQQQCELYDATKNPG